MKKLISIILALTLITSSLVCMAAEVETVDKTVLYVSIDGNDNNEGNIDSPLATFEGARNKLREIKKSGNIGKDGAVVYFREGKYNVIDTITFEAEDAGSKDAPIIYRAYPGENVSMVGGIIIPHARFKKTTDKSILNQLIDEDARERVVQLDLRAIGYTGELPYLKQVYREEEFVPEKELINPVQMFVGDTEFKLARYPNGDALIGLSKLVKMCQNTDFWLERKYTDPRFIPKEKRDPTDPLIFVPDDDRYLLWPEDGGTSVLAGQFGVGWYTNYAQYTIDKEQKQISTKHPLLYLDKVGPETTKFYGYNLLCELDSEYEMWISDKGIMYCILPDNASSEEIFFSTCPSHMFVFGEGAKYITLRGFELSKAKYGAAAFKEGSANNTIYDCDILQAAISINGKNNGIKNSYIHSTTVGLSGGDIEKLTNAENYAENCEFYGDGAKATATGVGNRVSYNVFHNSNSGAITISGKKQIIEFNEIYDVCNYVSDAGAIYSCGISKGGVADRGNIFRYNHIHDVVTSQPNQAGLSAIYNDDCHSGSLIVGNVIENINNGKGRGIHLGGSNDTIVDNNIFIDVNVPVLFDDRASWATVRDPENSIILLNLYTANKGYFTNEYWQAEFPELYERYKEFDPNTFAEAWGCRKTNNIQVNTGSDAIASSFKYLTIENNYQTSKDPGFIDAENGNYLLSEDSPVFKETDFKQIPVTRMGRYSDRALQRVATSVVLKNDSPYAFSKGKKVTIGTDEETLTPIEIGDSTYIPLRFVSEGMECEVLWDEATSSAEIITKEGKKIILTLDSAKALKDGEEIELANAPVLYKDRTYVPIRAFSEAVEYVVFWDNSGLICVSTDDRFNSEADKEIITYLADELDIY